MQIFRNIKDLKVYRNSINSRVGFVPTMGALHEGHASLIKKCREENEAVFVSTFVNPAQFLPNEDFEKYPKNEEADIKICESLGVDAMFIPKAEEMYSPVEPKIIAPSELSSILEGATRPGHFDGVLTVLAKFFNIIRPKNVYMGKKDAQQLVIVKNMVKSMFLDIHIEPCEIVREIDGLALSSRNVYLDEEEKLMALKISRALLKASNLVKNSEYDVKSIKPQILSMLEPLKVDYVAFVDREFNEISQITLANSIILIAAYVGKTRLIDNIWL